MEITITNEIIPNNAGYWKTTDMNATIASVKRMDELMSKYFQEKKAI